MQHAWQTPRAAHVVRQCGTRRIPQRRAPLIGVQRAGGLLFHNAIAMSTAQARLPPLRTGLIWRPMDSVAEFVRRRDPDRYFCTLFAPGGAREALMTLYAFNHELARAAEVTREPGLALIRLQWWREVVQGERRRHEVAEPLGSLLAAGVLPMAPLISMIEAREDVLTGEPLEPAALMRRGPGQMAAAAGAILGASPTEQQRLTGQGAACGLAGVLRNAALAPGRGGWPVAADRETALQMLGAPVKWRRAIVAAALPGVLARRDLGRCHAVAARGLADRLAVMRAAATCVI